MRQQRMHRILQEQLNPVLLQIEDESHMHAGNRQETHFKVLVVSTIFESQSRVQRQRAVQALLAEEFTSGLHALSLRCLTPDEARAQVPEFKSPLCHSKR